ncbi:hypothetical protein OG896_28375 [Streptomyces sp. NBC_00669]|uniref:hypothetical protein n=1 Tax=unclassified Streptomyces TaxID=2593676 RepID=UPI002E2EB18C|nr:hypothetical protein [Streptomyces sp. NBC_00669]
MPTGFPVRRALTALLLAAALLVLPACGSDTASTASHASSSSPSPTTSAQRQKLAKTRFVANAGLAAGATYQWIVKPYKAGKFKKGAHGRTVALIKAGLAGTFAYNRLKAASVNAKGDPTLNRLMAPVTAGITALKDLPSKLRKGENPDSTVNSFNDVINEVKDAGKSAGADVKEKVPSLSQLGS